MKVPILRLGDVLIAVLQGEMSDSHILRFEQDLGEEVTRSGASGVIIDISALDVVDSYMARVLNDVSGMLKLLGCSVVLCGMQPPVALTLVDIGCRFESDATAFDLEQALDRVRELIQQASQPGIRSEHADDPD